MAETAIAQHKDAKMIGEAYEDLFQALKLGMSKEDLDLINRAFEMAKNAHKTQRRKSGEPYILHPIAVAKICVEEIGLGATAIASALLHDVVEDTSTTIDEIRTEFGPVIGKIVDGLTKLDQAYCQHSPQAENFKKVLSTLVDDVRVVLIKMADRLHNMRTIGAMPVHKQLKIAAETSYIYAPLAHRLGLYNIKTEFLDICMKITEPDNYHLVARKLNETKRDRNRYINGFINPLKEKLDLLGFPYRIFGRPKSIYSIWNKMRKKRVAFEEIYDLFAIRIILDVPIEQEKMACWQVFSVITDVHQPVSSRLKDWISVPKANGYESLHTTVVGPKGKFVEIQIRTERMNEIAEMGFAAHWKYKGLSSQPDVFERWLSGVRELLEDSTADAVQFLGDFKTSSLFNEEVYVYTPKGDLKMLPKGSTALDFAFSIHSDLGYHCTAIKVNNKLVPLGYELQNGDQIQVMTNPNQKPNEDWLNLVTTGKGKAKIRSAMKEEKRKQGIISRETIERKFKKLKIQDYEKNMDILANHFGYDSHVDFYYDIARENLSITDVFKPFGVEEGQLILLPEILAEKEAEHQIASAKTGATLEKKRIKESALQRSKLLINGEPAAQFSFSFASCCNPMPGDEIFAYLTTNAGLKIHRSTCPNGENLMVNYGYRMMRAEWVGTVDNSSFVADLKITGIDDGPGVIERLSRQISGLGLNMRSMSIEGKEGYFEGTVRLLVANTNQLNMVIKRLKNLPNISTVSREEVDSL